MKTFLVVIFALTLIIAAGLYGWGRLVQSKLRKLAKQKYDAVKPLIDQLAAGKQPTEAELILLVKNASLRRVVFDLLVLHGRSELFPPRYCTLEKGAESDLVTWLEFPTELGQAPESIELVMRITIPEDRFPGYFVFKYFARPSRWARHSAWMLGVCGPYYEESKPYDLPLRVYSRFNIVGSITPEVEAHWIHEHISPRSQA